MEGFIKLKTKDKVVRSVDNERWEKKKLNIDR